ncbi:MAG: phytoene desaturase [Phreatobacter sp.]|uniref:phytoene desaturase n=1 Tax=Phreatobacter sp. TaxID=1966341 RepID=UPI0040355108
MTAPIRHPLPIEDRRPHAVVIGSGFGGLAAAVRLSVRGYRVSVLEKLDQPGGRARVFRQDGFTFDAGPTIVTAPFLFDELWTLCGQRREDHVDLLALEPFYRLRFNDGSSLDCSGDPDVMRANIARIAPGDVAGYDRFMAKSAEICRIGFEQLGHVPFGSVMDMIRVAPDLIRLSGHRSVHHLVSRYVKDERLRIALSFHPLFVGGNPFTASAIYGLIAHLERRWGVHFARGGTGRLVSGLVDLIRSQGGTVRLGAEVRHISVTNGRATGVVLAGGEAIAADVVVSNADVTWTYGRLLPEGASRRWRPAKLARASQSMSLFVWYFGTDRTYPDVPHHTILLGPRYRGLLDDIFRRKVLAEDFSLYLHRPTATDGSLAPAGHDAFYVLSPVPNLAGGEDWSTVAEAYRARIAAHLEATMLPGLRDHVVTSRIMTPVHFRDELNAPHGAAFSLEPVLTQSAWFRPHNRSEDVAGLYLVGAGTHPGAGLPGVLSSARILDEVIPHASALAPR